MANASPLPACRPPCRALCPLHRAAVQQARRMRLEIPASPSPVNGRGTSVTNALPSPICFRLPVKEIPRLLRHEIVAKFPLPFTGQGHTWSEAEGGRQAGRGRSLIKYRAILVSHA